MSILRNAAPSPPVKLPDVGGSPRLPNSRSETRIPVPDADRTVREERRQQLAVAGILVRAACWTLVLTLPSSGTKHDQAENSAQTVVLTPDVIPDIDTAV